MKASRPDLIFMTFQVCHEIYILTDHPRRTLFQRVHDLRQRYDAPSLEGTKRLESRHDRTHQRGRPLHEIKALACASDRFR